MASDTILPAANDHANHVAMLVQAKLALAEGQFPIRIAPLEHGGWMYPLFQFYSPLLYTIGGLVYGWLTPTNPFMAYKAMLWAALVAGGYFIHVTAAFLTKSRPAAVMAGVAYMSAPYFLVNIHARGAFSEAVAQGVLPIVVYCTLRCYFASGISPWFFASGLSWGALALTHNVTYVNTSLFLGLFVLSTDVRRWGISRALVRTGAAYAIGVLLAMYFLAVIVSADDLAVRETLSTMFWSRWLTPLATLLSPISLPPEPQPGHVEMTAFLHAGVGWPALFGVGMLAAACWQRSGLALMAGPRPRRVAGVLVLLFAVAFFMTWSPVDIWTYLPSVLQIAQFSYRWLAQIAWIGALALAYAVLLLFRGRLDGSHTAVGVMLIVMAHSSFLPAVKSNPITIDEIVHRADIGYGKRDYLVNARTTRLDPGSGGDLDVPATYSDGWLKLGEPAEVSRDAILEASDPQLVFDGQVASEVAQTPITLSILIDGWPAITKELASGPIGFTLPLKSLVEEDASSPAVRMEFLVNRTFTRHAIDPASDDTRPVAIWVSSLVIRGLHLKNAIPVGKTGPLCARLGATVSCHVRVTDRSTSLQLPCLFYPKLLDIRVNGEPVTYFPLRSYPYILAGVRLEPGVYDVTARFRGLAWANVTSALALLVTVGGLVWSISPIRRIW